nr:pyridoxal 5'-phosphate synthase glutaminase subunit PdxT [uncultured Aminipila sp.]
MRIAVLAVQGAFIEHEIVLHDLGVDCFEIRQSSDLLQNFDGLVLPGGESTVMGKLLRELNLFETLKDKIEQGTPVLATCAGLILLADKLENDKTRHFQTLPVTVKRNAYGRQLGSFETVEDMKGIGKVPMTFIRAPYIAETIRDVEVLAKVDKKIVAVRYKNQLAMSFHPELTKDTSVHRYFVQMVENRIN